MSMIFADRAIYYEGLSIEDIFRSTVDYKHCIFWDVRFLNEEGDYIEFPVYASGNPSFSMAKINSTPIGSVDTLIVEKSEIFGKN